MQFASSGSLLHFSCACLHIFEGQMVTRKLAFVLFKWTGCVNPRQSCQAGMSARREKSVRWRIFISAWLILSQTMLDDSLGRVDSHFGHAEPHRASILSFSLRNFWSLCDNRACHLLRQSDAFQRAKFIAFIWWYFTHQTIACNAKILHCENKLNWRKPGSDHTGCDQVNSLVRLTATAYEPKREN